MKLQKYGLYDPLSQTMYPMVKDNLDSIQAHFDALGIFEDEDTHFQKVVIIDLESFEDNKRVVTEVNKRLTDLEESFNKDKE